MPYVNWTGICCGGQPCATTENLAAYNPLKAATQVLLAAKRAEVTILENTLMAIETEEQSALMNQCP